jgi:hypothetical protein
MRKNTPAAGAEINWAEHKGSAEPAPSPSPLRAAPPAETKPTPLPSAGSRKRVQFDFSEEAYQRLEKLRSRTQKQSQAEVVRNSLRVYEWLLDQIEKGYAIQLTKGDFVKEVEILL